ncbi:acetyl-CoA carboxylase biotin carboxylase subunit [Planosporangium thailandense]|uniref:biotin carboxylase n=1 Tax=Planosporangium thailandense TaxID=765197 RepID=A0ABX0XV70_9ACTN|nr:acetyl-CoA carboxylase biotin carboxylase subunit [Planosporangium thailandense]NJC69928.1 acetyl-CoA carboxylase biotin carboxylase subunit [Planosporangium thailandense]
MFGKVLIANRGEIALRIARACREMGIRVVAVHSTEDSDTAVVRYADEAVCVGPAPARRSYLNIPAIVEAALRTGADAVHPGYGFLSEDPDFAEVCANNGITFIGPPPSVLASLGDKIQARSLMSTAGLPLLPGSTGPLDDTEDARAAADGIGFPVIIKAAAGGGGRGMRVVHDPDDFERAYLETRATAQVLFGSSAVFVERYLDRARHVEVQVLCDSHGNAIHLGERDCTVQRRHQKLIEESPAPGLPSELTARIGEAAVRGALAAGYVGAGTFEFLVDYSGCFYFMEVNPRIQVEHPVTEMVTGVDLVREQLRVAAGERLGLRQSEVSRIGAAIECRINAENPALDFVPTPGLLTEVVWPSGPFVRVDTHLSSGSRVSSAYDSLLAKLIVVGADRAQALARMRRALAELHVAGPGVHTTRDFLGQVLEHPSFVRAEHSTVLVDHIVTTGVGNISRR